MEAYHCSAIVHWITDSDASVFVCELGLSVVGTYFAAAIGPSAVM